MTERWRLINGRELFDIQQDPGQQHDLSADHPEVMQQLRAEYEGWWKSLAAARQRTVSVAIGSEQQPVVDLTAHDWLNEATPWDQTMIEKGPWQNGPWAIDVAQDGTYEITFSRWPLRLQRSLEASSARLSIQGQNIEQAVAAEADRVAFKIELKSGTTRLQGYLSDNQGRTRGPFFVRIRRLMHGPE